MNVCILSKFPPCQGGIAARTYWLARAYTDAGVSVHVVSNSNLVEPIYRIDGCVISPSSIPGITIHEVESEFPWIIPDEPHSLARLVDKALEVIQGNNIDVIDSGYLLPYGIAAFLVSRLTGVPYIVRHGGSDLAKVLRPGHLESLLKLVLNHAAAIITDHSDAEVFAANTATKVIIPPYIPNTSYFCTAERREHESPTLLFAGKINWHWQRKGLDHIMRCVRLLPSHWKMQWIGQGKGEGRFREFARVEMNTEVVLQRFITPWDMPHILKQTDYIFCLSVDDPIASYSNVAAEALCCGATVVVDARASVSAYSAIGSGTESYVLRVESADPKSTARSLMEHWTNRKNRNADAIAPAKSYEDYRSANVQALALATGQGKTRIRPVDRGRSR